MRFILVDRVIELVPGARARAVKCVTLSEDYLADHFPGYAVMPGVLLIESLAQVGGLLAEVSAKKSDPAERATDGRESVRRAILAQVDRAKFERMVVPGDRVELAVTLEQAMEGAARIAGEATVDGERAARCTLTFAMRAVPFERVHRERRALYEQWTRGLEGVELP
ncbi:MAG: 3-hydroxyacyl-ACP dehydratase FabZ [Myxococcales bacterium]|nr:3-hydroxyacyl-ACP dehydratase FabZ [Myxococcales bacterium]